MITLKALAQEIGFVKKGNERHLIMKNREIWERPKGLIPDRRVILRGSRAFFVDDYGQKLYHDRKERRKAYFEKLWRMPHLCLRGYSQAEIIQLFRDVKNGLWFDKIQENADTP